MRYNKKIGKRAQEEMFGFVIIIVMLMIIGVVFLFFFKPKATQPEKYIKIKVDNLLYSMASYNDEGNDVRAMIEECYGGINCDALESTLKNILDASFLKGSLVVGKQLRGYSLNITNTLDMSEGETTGNMVSSSVQVSSTNDIEATLSFYY